MAKKSIAFDSDNPTKLSQIILGSLQAEYGKDAATTSGADMVSTLKGYISTQCFALDLAIGRPGVPLGRLTVIQGKEASSKTTLTTHLLAECQKQGGLAIYIDAEYAFDADRAAQIGLYDEVYVNKMGLDIDPLLVLHPEHVEGTFKMIEEIIEKIRSIDPNRMTLIVWDSVAATPAKAEVEGDVGDVQPGLLARRWSAGLRKLTGLIAKENIALVVVNQIKEAIGGFGFGGAQTATIAQKPLGFHASVRIETVYTGSFPKDKKKATGIEVRAKITKNKIAPPFREAEFVCDFYNGIDDAHSRLSLATEWDIVKKAGSRLKFGEETFYAKDFPDNVPAETKAAIYEALEARAEKIKSHSVIQELEDDDESELDGLD